MKILHEGPGWNIETVCTGDGNGGGGCGSTLLVEEPDVALTQRGFYDGETEYYYTFYCGKCNVPTDLPPDSVPYRIRTNLLKNRTR